MKNRVATRQSILTRITLLDRLKNWEDQDSWREFFDIYWGLIYGWALKSGLTDTEGQEVVQEVVIEIATKIKNFKYDSRIGSFKGLLRKLSRWRIADQFRKRQKHLAIDLLSAEALAASTELEVLPEIGDGDAGWEDEWKRTLLAAAVEKMRQTLPPKHFQIMDLCRLRGWKARDVAQTVGLSTAQVYVIKCRVTMKLRQEISRLEKEIV